MASLWPEEFKEADIKTPKEIIEEQVKLLPKITGDMVYAELTELQTVGSDFGYKFRIRGKFLDAYNFQVFWLTHGLLIYPLNIGIDPEICLELKIENGIKINEQQEFEELFERILKSQRLKKVIGIIMKLSK